MAGYEKTHLINKSGDILKLPFEDSKGRCYNGKRLKQYTSTIGYNVVNIKGRREYVHRLVALTFLPNPKKTVNHINGIKTDNNLHNLEWASYSENNLHAYKTNLKVQSFKYKVKAIKDEATLICENVRDLAEKISTTESSIYRALSGKRETIKGYKVSKICN